LFDFVQTLVDASEGFRAAEKEAQKKIFNNLNVTGWDEFITIYRKARKEFHGKLIYERKAFWSGVYRYYGQRPDMLFLNRLEDEYWDIVKRERKPFPETLYVLEELSKRYKLGVVTNSPPQGSGNNYPFKDHSEIERYFEVIIVADAESIPSKPSPESFLLCLGKLGVSPEEAVYVGDDLKTDICGAKSAGIYPIWIQHHTVKRSWPEIDTDVPVINTLESLLNLEELLEIEKKANVKS